MQDINLQEDSRAQIVAITQIINLLKEIKPDQTQEYHACSSFLSKINYSVIEQQDLHNNDHKLLQQILSKSEAIKSGSKDSNFNNNAPTRIPIKNLYIQAEILSKFLHIPAANNEALHCYTQGELLSTYPELVLPGLKQLNPKFIQNMDLFKKNYFGDNATKANGNHKNT